MEPVPVTRGVRSTVRVAVALVVGQALLCALIGWLTLGRAQPGAPDGSAGVDRLALPPPGRRPMPTEEPAVTARPTATASRLWRPGTPTGVVETGGRRRPTPARTVSPAPVTASPQTLIAAPAFPPPVSTATFPALSVPPPPPLGPVQEPVTVGGRCRPEGAFGRTAELELVRCLRDDRHGPRWKIV